MTFLRVDVDASIARTITPSPQKIYFLLWAYNLNKINDFQFMNRTGHILSFSGSERYPLILQKCLALHLER